MLSALEIFSLPAVAPGWKHLLLLEDKISQGSSVGPSFLPLLSSVESSAGAPAERIILLREELAAEKAAPKVSALSSHAPTESSKASEVPLLATLPAYSGAGSVRDLARS